MDGRSEDRFLWVGFAVLAVLFVLLIWTTGILAGAIFGAGPATIPLGGAVAVLLRLPFHLSDPSAAWPAPARGRLPGAVPIYACAAVLFLGVCALGALAIQTAKQMDLTMPSFSPGRERPPAASWATDRDLVPLIVSRPEPRRLTLGRRGRRLLAAEAGQSLIVFGPTQTHKTSGLVIPALLEWEGPIVCTSVKNDLIGPTLDRRLDIGEVWVFDPAQQVGSITRSKATPLAGVHDWSGALRAAHWLAGSAKTGAGELSDADFWFANAEKLIAPLLLAAKRKRSGTMKTVVDWLDAGPKKCEDEVGVILDTAKETEAKRALLATLNREERQRSSVFTTAETILAAFADPRVARETGRPDYTPEALLEGKNTLYMVSPRGEQERLRTVFSTLIQELLSVVEQRSSERGGPIEPGLLMLLDECANIAPFPGLDEVASTASGLGVQLVTAFHDMSQVQARFGRRAPTIVNNHHAKLVARGISDVETLDYFSRLIGSGEFEQRSVSTQRGERSQRSQTEGDTYRELAPAHVLRQRAEASAVLVYGSLPPTTIELRPWFDDEGLKALKEVDHPDDPTVIEPDGSP